MKRIYLAAPYSHPEKEVRYARYEAVTKEAAKLMKTGHIVFSPITHSHYLAEIYGCPQEEEFWRNWYMSFLEHWTTDLYVLSIHGWKESNGVKREMQYAQEHGIPICYIRSGDAN